jgi:integrase
MPVYETPMFIGCCVYPRLCLSTFDYPGILDKYQTPRFPAETSSMPRTIRDANLGSREARARLTVRGKPHWRLIEPGLHLGYRRLNGRPGTWSVRRYTGEQTYTIEGLKGVVADDFADADGRTVLSFAQAQKRALGSKAKAGPFTVQEAVEDYLRHIESRTGVYDAGGRARTIIFPQLGEQRVEALTTARLRKWLADLADTPRRLRTTPGEPQRYMELDDSEEGRRRRRSSANRVLAILKAALNHAWREGHVASDAEWRRVKPFPGTVRSRARYLDVEECVRLVNASDASFRPLVQAALFTGCRYSELTRLTAGDFSATSGTLHITKSKTGKARHVVLTDEGVRFFAGLAAGHGSADLLFHAPRGGLWTKGVQQRPMLLACQRARIKPAVGFHALRHTWASLAVMNGTPLLVVAKNLGHAGTKMVEAHYGHLAPSYVADEIRKGAPRFGFKPERKVASFSPRGAR